MTSPALADSECSVHVVRAPDHVRSAIEARVGIEESSCTPLEVRVVVTIRKGYYVIATSPTGETFEGNVREPGLVGELVAGWARLGATTDEVPAIDDEIPEPERTTTAALEPPSEAPVVEVRASKPAKRRGSRDFVLGGVMTSAGFGLRGEIDILSGAGFTLGVALGYSTGDWSYSGEMSSSDLTFRDLRGVISAAKTFGGQGPWRLRVQAGYGVLETEYTGKTRNSVIESPVQGDGMTTTFEAAITASHDVGDHWAISLGPLFTYYGQAYELDNGIVRTRPTREYDVAGFMALRRRL